MSEALGGACKTSIIATFAPGVTSIEETMSTLRYAQGAMKALNVAQMPRSRQLEMALEELNAQYEDLVATSSARTYATLMHIVLVAPGTISVWMFDRRLCRMDELPLFDSLWYAVGADWLLSVLQRFPVWRRP